MTAAKLMELAREGKSIVWLSGRHMPATFFASMPFRFVMNLLPKIKQYKPAKKYG